MKAKKSLGQNFLTSGKALMDIVNAAEVNADDIVLEIGPGKGALTSELLALSCQVIAVEKDDDLYEFLKERFSNEISSKKLVLIHGDILDFEFESYQLELRSYKLIANIPYNITGAIFKKFLSAEHKPETMVLLVQKEVAERIARDKKESILSLSVKSYGKPKYVTTVKAGSFAPAPKVDSAILLIKDISNKFFKNIPEEKFFKALKAGFSSKRKKLLSNLSKMYDREILEDVFRKLDIDTDIRAEDLQLEEWDKLLKNLA